MRNPAMHQSPTKVGITLPSALRPTHRTRAPSPRRGEGGVRGFETYRWWGNPLTRPPAAGDLSPPGRGGARGSAPAQTPRTNVAMAENPHPAIDVAQGRRAGK